MGSANIVIPVGDVASAVAHYSAVLGVAPYTNEAYYAGFQVGDFEIGLVPAGSSSGATFVEVADLDAALLAAAQTGSVVEGAREVGGGRRVAVVEDADGSRLGLREG